MYLTSLAFRSCHSKYEDNALKFGTLVADAFTYYKLECPTGLCPGPARISTFVNTTIGISVSNFIPIKTTLGFGLPVLDCTVQLYTNLYLPHHCSVTPYPLPASQCGQSAVG